VPLLQVAAFMSSLFYFLPKNPQSVVAELQELKVKWKDHLDMVWH